MATASRSTLTLDGKSGVRWLGRQAHLVAAAVAVGLVAQAGVFFCLVVSDGGNTNAIELGRDLHLGEMPVGATWRGSVELRNRSWRFLRLDAPRVDCGCVTAHLADPSLPPRQSTAIALEVQFPEIPGPFARQIVLHTVPRRGSPKVVNLRGKAVADLWAVPSSVQVELNQAGEAAAVVLVHSTRNESVTSVLADRPEIAVCPVHKDNNSVDIKLTITACDEGAGLVSVCTSPDRPALLIPVEWKLRPEIQIRPDVWHINRLGHAVAVPETLGVAIVTAEADADLEVRPLVPWLKIGDVKRVSEHAFDVELRLLLTRVTERFSGEVLEVCPKSGRGKYYLRARIESSR